MKLILLSNFFNHHQAFISKEFAKQKNVDYSFIATMGVPEDRKRLGYSDAGLPALVCQSFLNEREKKRAERLLSEADVLITGSAPEQMVQSCFHQCKLVFRYAERPLKNGIEIWKYPVRFYRWHKRNPRNKPVYMLCASAFTPADYAKFGLFRKKTYKWGYFPQTKHYEIEPLIEKKSKNTILWCGRFLDWKHPDDAIKVAVRLKDAGYDFKLFLIGMGEMQESLNKMIGEKLQDCVQLLGSMKPEQVREHMEKAGIYLFTSDRKEGWGAVLNESMNSGCAVVASHAIGSVPFLLKDGENGLVYESGNVEMLYEKVKFLLDHPEEQVRLGKNAYDTIVDEWNAEEAAKRFMNLAEHILAGEKYPDLYMSGPCSKAEVLKDNWI